MTEATSVPIASTNTNEVFLNESSMIPTCAKCNKEFSNSSNLSRHLKEKHQNDNANIINYSCVLCDKKFKRRQHLNTHINAVHLQGSVLRCSKCNFKTFHKHVLSRHFRHHEAQGEKRLEEIHMNFKCTLCPRVYQSGSSLKQHLKEKQEVKCMSLNKKITYKKVCPLCPFNVSHGIAQQAINIMLVHFEKQHGIKKDYEKISFESISAFKQWKSNIEKETNSRYKVTRSSKKNLRYTCHRSGTFLSKGSGKRSLKLSGSCKINGFCPASLSVNISSCGKVNVIFKKSHVGHTNELKFLNLSQDEKEMIAASVANKIPYEEILRKIRRDVSGGNLERIHLTTRKDLINIASSFNLGNEAVHHSFDPVSVKAWADQFKSSNEKGMLFFKPQGESNFDHGLSQEDFVLIFMTNAQKEIFLRYGGDVVCVDGTHGVNSYNFQLYTILVLDDTREGVPVAFMVSNKGNEETMKLFFSQIKTVLGPIRAKVFMSDMDETFYNAWKPVMGDADMHIFCTWHVLKAWRKNINQKIKIKEKRDQTFALLRTLLCETDRDAFDVMLKKIISQWQKDNEMQGFLKYFSQYYLSGNKIQKWAYCCRIGAGINTNMALENFNKILKYCYLRGKAVRRLDKTLNAILNLIEDKLFDILIKVFKGKVVSKLRILRKRHRDGVRLDTETVVNDGNCWKIISSKFSDIYTVHRVNPHCHNCLLKCHHCYSCFHEYTCSCIDHGIKNNMCKHIHAIAKLQKEQSKTDILTGPNLSTEDTNFQKSVIEEISKKSNAKTNFFEDRENFLINISAMIREKVTNYEELEAVITHCKPIPHILNGMKTMPKSSVSAIMNNKPSTSKIIQQRKFFSTSKQKRRVKEVPRLSSDEKNLLAVQLMVGNQIHEETNIQNVMLDHDYCTLKTPPSQD